MNTPKAIFFQSTLFLIFLSGSGCRKIQDLIINHHSTTNTKCKIISFTSTSNYPPKTGSVYYNKYGNPDSVIFDDVSTGQGNFYMFYDSKNRLTDCLDMYTGTGVDTSMKEDDPIQNDLKVTNIWLKFIYDEDNRVMGDSIFVDKIFKPGSLRPLDWNGKELDKNFFVSKYEYDSKGRIIKVTSHFAGNDDRGASEKIYLYDENGNLIVPGRRYDKQISFLRTHKIWMLLAKDYSMNNPYPAIKYNSKGLPVEFDYQTTEYSRFLFTDMSQSRIVYSCK